jgi:AcrR family transcriptional regulator
VTRDATGTLDNQGQALLDAATELLATEGPEALTVRRIASTAGCSTMGLYSRFGGKDGVIERLWLDGFLRLRAAVEESPVTDDPLHDLEQIGVTYRRWALENATSYGIMFSRSVPEFVPSTEAKELSIGTFAVVVDAVRRAQARGHFPDADPSDIAQVLWAVSHGSVSLEIAGMTGPYPERMPMRAAIACKAIVAGLDATGGNVE